MNKTSGINYLEYNQPTQKEGLPEEGLIDKKLPSDVFKVVMSYLDNKSLQQASSVNRFWNSTAIDTAKHEVKVFTKFLKESNLHISQSCVDSDKKISEASNLIQIKSSIYEYREKILNLLKDLDEDTLKSLEESSKDHPQPRFFQNIFQLAGIYKKIDNAGQILNDVERWLALRNISVDLVQNGDIKKAIEVANMMPDDIIRGLALRKISKALAQNGDIKKAIEVASMRPDDRGRGITLQGISEHLMQNGKIEKAIEVANKISNDIRRGITLQSISEHLVQNSDIKKAIEVANLIPDDIIRERALMYLRF
ncbi:MAG: hypothetical protein Tsb0015_12050 [Simkaniaceae bacterium]